MRYHLVDRISHAVLAEHENKYEAQMELRAWEFWYGPLIDRIDIIPVHQEGVPPGGLHPSERVAMEEEGAELARLLEAGHISADDFRMD